MTDDNHNHTYENPPATVHGLPSAELPNNQFAEQAILGAIIHSTKPDAVPDGLQADDFYDQKHRIIIDAIMILHKSREAIDLVTVSDKLRARGELDTIGGLGYLAKLDECWTSSTNLQSYIDIVKDCALKRAMLTLARDMQKPILQRREESAADLLDNFQQAMIELCDSRQTGSSFNRVGIAGALSHAIDLQSREDGMTGIPSGFIDLDRMTGGFQSGELIVIAGRPSMGKTALAMNFAQHAAISADAAASVAVFSLEMSEIVLWLRCFASMSEVPLAKIMRGDYGTAECGQIYEAAKQLETANIHIDDSTRSPAGIAAKARKQHRPAGLDMVIIDYLQLLDLPDSASANRAAAIGDVTRGLKALAKDLDMPVIVLSQLNRAVEQRADKRPIMPDLRDSGAIEQDADLIVFLYRDEYYNDKSEHAGIAEINIAKHRNGETGKIKLAWRGEIVRFDSYSPASLADI